MSVLQQIISIYKKIGLLFAAPFSIAGAYSFSSGAVNSNGLFVLCGVNAGNNPGFTRSSDGVNWSAFTAAASNNAPFGVGKTMAVLSTNRFACLGFSFPTSTSQARHSYTSADGITWTGPHNITLPTVVQNGFTVPANLTSMAETADNNFIAVGFENTPSVSAGGGYVRSANGSTWSAYTGLGGTVAFRPTNVTKSPNGTLWCLGTGVSSGTWAYKYSTNNGSAWTEAISLTGNVTEVLGVVCAADNSVLIVGIVAGSNSIAYAYSKTPKTAGSWSYGTISSDPYRKASIAVNSSGVFVVTASVYKSDGSSGNAVYFSATSDMQWSSATEFSGVTGVTGKNAYVLVSAPSGRFVAGTDGPITYSL